MQILQFVCRTDEKRLTIQICRLNLILMTTVLLTALTVVEPTDADPAHKLLPSDAGTGNNYFGSSIAVSGDTAVVGAVFDDDNGLESGSAYIFVRDARGVWKQEAKLLPADGTQLDVFGQSVAIFGDTAIVGAPGDGENDGRSGSLYVFVRNAEGFWSQEAKLSADDGAMYDEFGGSIAIDGNTVVVGARLDDDDGSASGSAYVFVRDADGAWTQSAKLRSSDAAAYDKFGISVAISGETVVVGASYDSDNGIRSGSVYVFARDAFGDWRQQAKLVADDGAGYDFFGEAIGISGPTVVVGTRFDDVDGVDSGSAYVFARNHDGKWTQKAKLLPDDGAADDRFGVSVAIKGDRIIVGSWLDDDNGSNSGSAYTFVRGDSSIWTQDRKLLPGDGSPDDFFGYSVAMSRGAVVVGVAGDNVNKYTFSGSAYAFDLNPSPDSDLNGDGVVNGADLAALLTQWGTTGPADLNNDGVVNGVDLAILLTNWG